MRKHLHRIGNSYGIIIDSSIRRLLGIGSRSVLEVSTDGERILIERTGQLLTDDELPRARHILAAQEDASVRAGRPGQNRTANNPGANKTAVNRKLLRADMQAVSMDFERRYHASPQQLQRLHHVPNQRFMRILCWMASSSTAQEANDEELATLLRMRYCRDQLRVGSSWDEAIEAALLAYPMRSVTPSDASSGQQQPTIEGNSAS
jgi:hypothetical protein